MSIECEKVRGINQAQGVCDTELPAPVRQGARQALDQGLNSYTRFDGIAELREAIAHKFKTYNGLEFDPETEITVSAGSPGAFYCACLARLSSTARKETPSCASVTPGRMPSSRKPARESSD